MSVADRFAEELATAAAALGAAHTLVAGLALDSDSTTGAGVQDPGYLAHTLSNLRHATADIEFIAHGLYRRARHAAHHDTYPAPLRDLLSVLAADLHAAQRQAHTVWRVMCTAENHGCAMKAATRGARATVTAAGDQFAAATTTATNALSAAHTILAGLSQDYYGGQAVLDAAILARALSTLRQTARWLQATVRVLKRHVSHLTNDRTRPDTVREPAAELVPELSGATVTARGLVQIMRRLADQAPHIQEAAQGITFML